MDNFDLKKFLKESKALENLNPTIKALNENEMSMDKKMTKEAIKKQIKDMIVAELEGGSSNNEKIRIKYNEMFGKNPQTTFKDVAKALNLPEDEVEMALQGGSMFKEETDTDMMDPIEEGEDPEEIEYEEDTYDYSNDFYDGDSNDFGDTDEFDGYGGYDIDEAKKKDEEVEDVEDVEVTDTEEEMPAEEAPSTTGGLEDISADMEGTEGDLMDHLMSAFKIAKGMGNEKLETQVGNTLKFFVSEYIGGEEN
jgi:hypothetical protein